MFMINLDTNLLNDPFVNGMMFLNSSISRFVWIMTFDFRDLNHGSFSDYQFGGFYPQQLIVFIWDFRMGDRRIFVPISSLSWNVSIMKWTIQKCIFLFSESVVWLLTRFFVKCQDGWLRRKKIHWFTDGVIFFQALNWDTDSSIDCIVNKIWHVDRLIRRSLGDQWERLFLITIVIFCRIFIDSRKWSIILKKRSNCTDELSCEWSVFETYHVHRKCWRQSRVEIKESLGVMNMNP